jgi:hypothetical protein
MFLSTNINPAVAYKIIGLLTPLFLCSAGTDVLTARHAASQMLAAYNVQTEEELRLAAEIIGFGFGALDALSRSTAHGLSISAILRLRGSANAQHRSANQCQRTLEKLRKERRIAPSGRQNERPTSDVPRENPVAAETVPLSNDTQAPKQLTQRVVLSRQQRRAAERKAGKIQRKHSDMTRHQAKRATPTIPPQRLYNPTPADERATGCLTFGLKSPDPYAAFASAIARQTRSGVAGISM